MELHAFVHSNEAPHDPPSVAVRCSKTVPDVTFTFESGGAIALGSRKLDDTLFGVSLGDSDSDFKKPDGVVAGYDMLFLTGVRAMLMVAALRAAENGNLTVYFTGGNDIGVVSGAFDATGFEVNYERLPCEEPKGLGR